MVEFAALRVEAAGLGSRITTRQADAQDLSAWQARSRLHVMGLERLHDESVHRSHAGRNKEPGPLRSCCAHRRSEADSPPRCGLSSASQPRQLLRRSQSEKLAVPRLGASK